MVYLLLIFFYWDRVRVTCKLTGVDNCVLGAHWGYCCGAAHKIVVVLCLGWDVRLHRLTMVELGVWGDVRATHGVGDSNVCFGWGIIACGGCEAC